MILSTPRLVILDTATVNYLADKPNDSCSKDLMGILCGGDWIPFLTLNVLQEMACHENDSVFQKRFDSLRQFPFVAHLKKSQHETLVGGSYDLINYEAQFLIKFPNATHQEIIEDVRPKICNGFSSGSQIVSGNSRMCQFFRANCADLLRQQKAETENLSHFLVDMKEPILEKGEKFVKGSKQNVADFLRHKAITLERKIIEDGECRDFNLKPAIAQKLKDIGDASQKILASEGDFVEEWFKEGNVERSRLPKKPNTGDYFYECFFMQCMESQTKLLVGEEKEKMRSIRKEQLPSWVIWQELDRRMKQMPKAEIGNMEDRNIASFVPYVDLINVDKRVAEMFRQLSTENQLFFEAYKRVPEKRGLPGLIEALKKN